MIVALVGDGPPPAVFYDHWLLQHFPGRTLEELEDVDLPAHFKAFQVGPLIEQVSLLEGWRQGKVKAKQLEQVPEDVKRMHTEARKKSGKRNA